MGRTKECPNCATDILEGAEVCPICRYDFPARAALPWKPVAALLLVILLVSFALMVRRWFSD